MSHLLFADDSLFFCRATTEDISCMAEILSQYEMISGQKVNYDKSSIIFGRRIPQNLQSQIHHIMKITATGGGGKYLGLPEKFG